MRTTTHLLLLLWWPASAVLGQDSTVVVGERAEVIQTLQEGQLIRVLTSSRGSYQGTIAAIEGSELWVVEEGVEARIAVAEVERLWVHGHAARTGAFVGVLTGVVLGAAAGLFIGEVICDNPDCRADTGAAVLTLGLGGGGAGAVMGGVIGLAIPKWHQRYP